MSASPIVADPAVENNQTVMRADYGRQPLGFEVNQGQTSDSVDFLSRGEGYTLFLTPSEAVISLKQPTNRSVPNSSVLHMELLNANSTAIVAGKEQQSERTNYLRGNDPAKWHTNIPVFGRVEYQDVYPGVDVVYYGSNQRQLEYDFVVAPGADPEVIALRFSGAEQIELSATGDLVLHTDGEQVVARRPIVYQEANGIRTIIASSYVLSANEVRFQVGAYDTSRPLTIDPILVYANELGGAGFDAASSIAIDSAGNAYVTGQTQSDAASLPVLNAFQAERHGAVDAFVAKYSPEGFLIYSTYFGGGQFDSGAGIAVDTTGNIYVAGVTFSTDLPIANALQPSFSGPAAPAQGAPFAGDAFIAKLDATGSSLLFSTYLGGSGADGASSVALNAAGIVYVAGGTESSDFLVYNALQESLSGQHSGFVTKLNLSQPNPNQPDSIQPLVYSTFLGNSFVTDIAVDAVGAVYATGNTSDQDVFVRKLNSSGSVILYDVDLGGSGIEFVHGIAADGSGNAYVTGDTSKTAAGGADFPTTIDAYQGTSSASVLGPGSNLSDAFVTKFDRTGQIVYSTFLGGDGVENEGGGDIAVDGRGLIYITGSTSSFDFPTTPDALQDLYGGGTAPGGGIQPIGDAFITKLNPFLPFDEGLIYSSYFGGVNDETGHSIAVNTSGSEIYIAGDRGVVGSQIRDAIVIKMELPGQIAMRGLPITTAKGRHFTAPVAEFTAPGRLANEFTATIDWGDGSQSPGIIQLNGLSGNNFLVIGSNTYLEHGAFPIVVRLNDFANDQSFTANNVSLLLGNQAEGTIAVDPNKPARQFVATVTQSLNGKGLFVAVSDDSGLSWTPRIIADGHDELPEGHGSPKAIFDDLGNLFLAYLNPGQSQVHTIVSTDGGQSFSDHPSLSIQDVSVDQPSLVVGPGPGGTGHSVWLSAAHGDPATEIVITSVVGQTVTGLGTFSMIGGPITLPESALGARGDLAVGPLGQVLVTYQTDEGEGITLRSQIKLQLDPDGIGPAPFTPLDYATYTNVLLNVHNPATDALIDAEASLAWDRSGGEHNGRVYLIYVDAVAVGSEDTAIYLRYSDNSGLSWSDRVLIRGEQDGKVQFLPAVAVDQTTGAVTVTWYDTSNDIEADMIANNESQVFAATSLDGGVTFDAATQPLNVGLSTEDNAIGEGDIDFGGYAGVAFVGGVFYSVLVDNSVELYGNPDRPNFDIAVAAVGVARVVDARLQVFGRPVTSIEGQPFSGLVAVFDNAGADVPASNYTASINWGDGTTTPGIIVAPAIDGEGFEVIGSHTFQRQGGFPIVVTIHDNSDNSNSTTNTNVTAAPGHQAEGTIAIDPTDPNRQFLSSVDQAGKPSPANAGGIFAAYTTDGGVNWTPTDPLDRIIADGNDLIPVTRGDPRAVFDQFGNLFLTYLSADQHSIVVVLSTDGGQSFRLEGQFTSPNKLDQPTVAVGPGSQPDLGSVWVSFSDFTIGYFATFGTSVTGLGLVDVFGSAQVAPGSIAGPNNDQGALGDLAIGPAGELIVSWQQFVGTETRIYTNLDPDGLGPAPFGQPVLVTNTLVGQDPIPPQANRRILAEANLAWDRRTTGIHSGRVYLSYTDRPMPGSSDTNIMLRYSDDQGATWSPAKRVNDDLGQRSQFLPSIAVDQETGYIALAWHDAREDLAQPAVKTKLYSSVSGDGGRTFSPNIALNLGLSDATVNQPGTFANNFQYGDYTGMVFAHGFLFATWADNSLELGANPNRPLFDQAVASPAVARVTDAPISAVGQDLSLFSNKTFMGSVATFVDNNSFGQVEDFAATIDWGDGQQSEGVISYNQDGYFQVLGSHKYASEGEFSVNVIIESVGGATAATTGSALVLQKILATGNAIAATSGKANMHTVASFYDAEFNDDPGVYTATISWGDGSPNSIGAISTDGVQFFVSGLHTYAVVGNYTVSVTIQDLSGPSATVTSAATIVAPFLFVDEELTVIAFEDVTTGAVPLATFTIVGPVGNVSTYSATIVWGDASPNSLGTLFVLGNTIEVSGVHTFVTGGTFHPIVTLNKADQSTSATATVDVGFDVSSQVLAVASGVVYNPATQVFYSDVTITNISFTQVDGPIVQIVLTGLPVGIEATNAAGYTGAGDPYINKSVPRLNPGQSITFPIVFSNPSLNAFTFDVTTYSDPPSWWIASQPDPFASAPTSTIMASTAASPFSFEANQGQTAAEVKFVARGPGYVLFLAEREVVLTLGSPGVAGPWSASAPAALRMQWTGGNPASALSGVNQLAGVSNYLLGNDASAWQTDILRYGQVHYEEVYDGIDLVFYGREGTLEYDWVVASGADPSKIAFAFDGAEGLSVDGQGNLVIQVAGGAVLQRAPVLYQDIAGVRHSIAGSYTLLDNGQVGFNVGAYDLSRPLVIDPVLVYSTYLGGNDSDTALNNAVDLSGNQYVVGYTASLDFPTLQAGQPQHAGGRRAFYQDAFVTKLDPNGVPIFSTYFGGGDADRASGIAVDANGNVLVAGFTSSENFPTLSALQPSFGGASFDPGPPLGDGFLIKLNSAGSSLVYGTFLGGSAHDTASDVAVDYAGNAYVTGITQSNNFPVLNAIQPQHAVDPIQGGPLDPHSTEDAFVIKIGPTGAAVYSTYIGGNQLEIATGIAVDTEGNAYLTGYTSSTNWPLANPTQAIPGGLIDAFVTKLNSSGSTFVFSTYLGGSGNDYGIGIAVDSVRNIFVTGQTASSDFLRVNPLQPTLNGVEDAFVTKLDSTGAAVYSTYLGGSASDQGNGIAVDAAGNAIVVGATSSVDFPTRRAVQSIYRGGDQDGFVTTLSSTGSNLVSSTFLGGSESDTVSGVALDANGNAYVTGSTDSLDLRVLNATQGFFSGGFGRDAFVARINAQGSGILRVFNKPIQATEGSNFSGLVASFTDTDHDLAGDFNATIDWGDGQFSSGSITGNGYGNFDIFGTHLYTEAGFYSAHVTVYDPDGSVHVATSSAAGANSSANFVDYHLSIDTSALNGTTGSLSFQFNVGAVGAQAAEVQLTNFVTTGGVGQPSELIIDNTGTLNWLTSVFNFGGGLSFDVRLSGVAIADPTFALFGSRFAVQLLSSDGLTPMLSTNPAGMVLSIDITPDGATRFTSFTSGATASARNTAIVLGAGLESAEIPIFVTEGVAFNEVVATFTSGNALETAADFVAVIEWGDGSPSSTGLISPDDSGGFTVTGAHIYSNVGQFRLSVAIRDRDGDSTQTSSLPIRVGGFQSGLPSYVGGTLGFPQIADLNGDSIPDIVIPDATANGKTVAVVLGKGDGTFHFPIRYAVGTGPLAATLGDFNGDGRLDIAVASVGTFQAPSGPYSGSRVDVLFGNGDGTFQAAVSNPTAPFSSLVSGDFNHDGNLDLALGRSNNPAALNVVGVLMGKGDGTFQPEVYYTVPGTSAAPTRVRDLNADGNPDLVVASSAGISTLLGNGDGTFRTGFNQSGLNYLGDDFNGDGQMDAARVNPTAGTVTILLGSGGGSFLTGESYTAKGQNVAVGDFNGDGRPDFLLYDRGAPFSTPVTPGVMNILLGNGDGTFQPATSYSSISRPSNVVLADFNQDGNLDVAATDGISGGVVTVALGSGDGTLISPNVFAGGGGPRFTRATDLNGDGNLDLVTVNTSATVLDNVSVQLGNGDGTLQPPVKYLIGTEPISVAIGDLNGDGKPDIVVGFANSAPGGALGNESISVLRNNGDGTFGAPVSYSIPLRPGVSNNTGKAPTDLALGDVNGDGKTDLVVAANHSSSVFLGNGNGTLQSPSFFTSLLGLGNSSHAIALGDFNNDGNLDIAGAVNSGSSDFGAVAVYLNNGTGTFSLPLTYITADKVFSIAAADLNGDGKTDVAAASDGNDVLDRQGSLSVLLGVGNGTLKPAVEYATGHAYNFITVADFNGDGRPDLAGGGGVPAQGTFTSGLRGGVSVLMNKGNGTFGTARVFETSSIYVSGLVAGDFNGDGTSDLASANDRDNTISLLLNIQTGTLTGATVTNAPLVGLGRDINPLVNVAFAAVVATFTDANAFGVAGDYAATIDWGDGSTSPGSIAVNLSGGFDVLGSHTYAQIAVFPINVTIGDDDGAIITTTSAARVKSINLPINAVSLAINAQARRLFLGSVATFSDADPSGSAGDFGAQINWGDGQNSAGAIALDGNGGFVVLGEHTYASAGNYVVGVLIVDIAGGSASTVGNAMVSLTPNAAPVARNDSAIGFEDMAVSIDVLVNDGDLDHDTLHAIVASGPSHGTLTLNADGSFTYLPNANFFGSDHFTYLTNDGSTNSNLARVSIVIKPINDAPIAVANTYSVPQGASLTISGGAGVLGNDSDVDGDFLTATLAMAPAHGQVVFLNNGSFTYTPAAGYIGSDSFTYRAFDGERVSAIAVVSIVVLSPNQPPLARADLASTVNYAAVDINVLANDIDANGDPLTAILLGGVAHGTLTQVSDGVFRYTPMPGFSGRDSFLYQASDGRSTSNTALVSFIVLAPANIAPVINALSANSVVEGGLVRLMGTYTDSNLQDIHTIAINWGEGATETIAISGGSFDITHRYLDDNPTGSQSDAYTITAIITDDRGGVSAASSVAIVVSNVAPVLINLFNSASESELAVRILDVVTITATFTDVGLLDTHTLSIDWGDGHVTAGLVMQSSGGGTAIGSHVYTTVGFYSITVTLTDDDGGVSQLNTTAIVFDPPVVTASPLNTTVVAGTTATFTASASGSPVPTVKWQVSADNGANFSDIVGATSTTYSFTAALSDSGKQYRAIFNHSTTSATTAAATLSVNPASVVSAGVSWGTSGNSALVTQADGLRLLPQGRTNNISWLGVNRLTITLNGAVGLAPGDVSVRGVAVANYGPVTISGGGTTYTITLAQPINLADRVTVTIGNASIVTFVRRLDILPGDVNDDGYVNSTDATLTRAASLNPSSVPIPFVFMDINGDGFVDSTDFDLVRRRSGQRLR